MPCAGPVFGNPTAFFFSSHVIVHLLERREKRKKKKRKYPYNIVGCVVLSDRASS